MPTAQEIAELKRSLIPAANQDDPESLKLLESGWTARDLVQYSWKRFDWLFFLIEVDNVPDAHIAYLIPSCNKRVL